MDSTAAAAVPRPPATCAASRWAFLRLLAAVHLVAFVSLRAQIDGLVGSRGILPVAGTLAWARDLLGTEAYLRLPTLVWLDPSDRTLHLLSAAGVVLAGLLAADVAPALCLAGLWALSLSLAVAGQVFLEFQWETLLLETTFCALFVAPWRLGPPRGDDPPPPRAGVWLVRFVLFKLILLSGLAKIGSGDPTWRDLTALEFHYETQPLPTRLGWWAHQAPAWVHRLSCAGLFAIELGAPWLVWAPSRRARLAAFVSIAGLQAAIAATGNYGFFNLLTVVLCLPLLDDGVFGGWAARFATARSPSRTAAAAAWCALVAVVALSALRISARGGLEALPAPAREIVARTAPLRTVNTYGLFAVMTRERPEVVIEGTADGVVWREYEFRWKPGDPRRAPGFVAPHMPRLDWQMWFAALGPPRANPWVGSLLERLLANEPAVVGLLETNPFPDRPPRAVRAVLYEYEFTTVAQRRATGAWWKRRLVGPYGPIVTRR